VSAGRRDRVRARLGDLDALLVSSPVNVRWLCGLQASRASLLLTRDGDVLSTDGRYAGQAAEVAPELELVVARDDGWVADRVPARGRLGVEADRVTWAQAERLRALLEGVALVPASGLVEAERLCKDTGERALLERACRITADTLADVAGALRPGLSERRVARMVEDGLRDRGADDRAFATIVASGPNGAGPHHVAGQRLLAAGDLVTIDAGALVDGYHADMTRTVAIGAVDPLLARAYEAVRVAQAAGVEAVRAGVTAGAVDVATREVLTEAGFADAIRHPTGHGVGLEIHEPPILRQGETATLPAGAVVTVEPGVYLTGLGGVRIEDTVAVADTGCEVLTAAPTDLLTV
jgi:Xaa-Pro aminopeptidase